jgi:hypothetical protein
MNSFFQPRNLSDRLRPTQDFHDDLKLEPRRVPSAVFLGHHLSLFRRLLPG